MGRGKAEIPRWETGLERAGSESGRGAHLLARVASGGRALEGRRDQVVLATKFGMKVDEVRQGAKPDYGGWKLNVAELAEIDRLAPAS